MIAAASITHDNGFHMNPKNLRILLCCRRKVEGLIEQLATNYCKKNFQLPETKKLLQSNHKPSCANKTIKQCQKRELELKRTDFSSSLFGPQILIRTSPSASVKPCLEHLNCSNTSSTGICSCISLPQHRSHLCTIPRFTNSSNHQRAIFRANNSHSITSL